MINANDALYDLNDILNKIKVDGYSKFTEFAKDVISTGTKGHLIDLMMPMLAYNVLIHRDLSKFDSSFFRVIVDNVDDLLKLAREANGSFMSFHGMVLFCVYNDFDIFPLARVYTFQASSIAVFTDAIKQSQASGILFNQKNFEDLSDGINAETRISEHLSDLDVRLSKIKRFVQGKIDNTSVSGGIAIARRDNVCANCAKENADQLESITSTNFSSGVHVSMEVCSTCLSSSAERNVILNSLFTKTDLDKVIKERQLSIAELRKISNAIVKHYLNSDIETYASNDEDTITAITSGGFTLKLRLTSIKNYGYMILNSNGEELIRFDSAPDHPDKVEFMPHHVHNNVEEEESIKKKAKKLSKKKAKELKKSIDISDSFLSGFLGIDYVSINRHLDRLAKCI
ncbi:toxin-antitoxin system TumE family protein [Oceanisphaera ostreae]|uniref:DUF6516 family protein n=1 Tax=Oceanisphaera ostreae TaxID=914151 RepID=A0ABW3KG50_9GAMM